MNYIDSYAYRDFLFEKKQTGPIKYIWHIIDIRLFPIKREEYQIFDTEDNAKIWVDNYYKEKELANLESNGGMYRGFDIYKRQDDRGWRFRASDERCNPVYRIKMKGFNTYAAAERWVDTIYDVEMRRTDEEIRKTEDVTYEN